MAITVRTRFNQNAAQGSSYISVRDTSFDASSGSFPSTGGRHTDGAPAKFDAWIIGVAGTLAGQDVSIGTIIMANVNGPGSAWGSSTGWSILRF